MSKEITKNIIICGATATGKTHIAEKLALGLNGEIVSADSMQIYKKMNIGTAKEELSVKQHMINICEPDEEYSVYNYSYQARMVIEQLNKNNKIAIICGGTGLYIDSLLYKMNYGALKQNDPIIKIEIENNLKKYGPRYIYNELINIDPKTAAKIHVNNIRRITRALYLCRMNNNKPISEIQKKIPENKYILYIIDRDRDKLIDRINLRVEKMFNLGLRNEVTNLLRSGYTFDLQSMQAIGYKEWNNFFYNSETEQQVKDKILVNTRQYAKRQVTWFKNQYINVGQYCLIKKEEDMDEFIYNTIKLFKEN
ncbi:MAG: tRNA (adenosine(37)-N6)-dimethylallyltransferase MiaA [Clostridia bacterium]|nr:tRNA (adenosine(37)-N6)-dimethylallyltransferase MiaA [Clostridia bacterium]